MSKDEYLIHELASETGIDERTIRYYQQEGLLPKPDAQGKYAYYREDHLLRLKIIQELKKKYLPLKEIRELLNSLTLDQVQALLESQKIENMSPPSPSTAAASKPAQELSGNAQEYIARLLHPKSDFRIQEHTKFNSPYQQRGDPQRYVAGSPSESWRRVLLVPGIEVQIREPLSPQDQMRLEELIKFAKKLFS
jgi:DNA-binding transcriptional MerR regulator